MIWECLDVLSTALWHVILAQLILFISEHSASHLPAVLYIVLPRHPKQLVLRLLECSLADWMHDHATTQASPVVRNVVIRFLFPSVRRLHDNFYSCCIARSSARPPRSLCSGVGLGRFANMIQNLEGYKLSVSWFITIGSRNRPSPTMAVHTVCVEYVCIAFKWGKLGSGGIWRLAISYGNFCIFFLSLLFKVCLIP